MSDQPDTTPEPDTETPDVTVEGDAVVNQAPDGGGIDNEASEAEADQPAADSDSSE